MKAGTCQAQLITIFGVDVSPPPFFTIQYFIGTNPITSVIIFNSASPPSVIEAQIEASVIEPGVTITATYVNNGDGTVTLTVLIEKTSTTIIMDLAIIKEGVPPNQVILGTSPFTCNIVKKRRRNNGASLPSPGQICIKSDPNNPNCPPPNVQFKNTGAVYELIGKDEKGNCCYRIKR